MIFEGTQRITLIEKEDNLRTEQLYVKETTIAVSKSTRATGR